MNPPSAAGPGSTDLLLRLVQAADFAEGAEFAVVEARYGRSAGRGLLLVAGGDALRAVHGIGWDPDGFADLPLAGESPAAIAEAFRGTEPRRIESAAGELLGLDAEAVVALPVPARLEPWQPFGLLLTDVQGLAPARVEALAAALRCGGPLLARLWELDELQREKRQVERHRELLTSIVNALPDPVLITDAENRILMENQRAEALLTTSDADSEGRRRAVEINNLLFSSFLARAEGEDDARGSDSRELNLVDPMEGGDLLFEVLSTPLPESVYRGAAMVSVLREVTDLKRAAAELERQFKRVRQAELKSRRERDRLNLILETVGDPILVTDDQANIILMNREAERLFEIAAGADLQDRRRQDVRANDTKFSSFISDLALSPDPSRVAEMQLTDPENGEPFPAEVVSGKIFNERSEMAAIVSIVHDMTKVVENERLAAELARLNEGLEDRVRAATTELEQRNRQLEWQRQELERAYRLKSEFLASMSHELRTPINALLGYTSLMRDNIYGDLTERQDEALQRMYAASQHLLELVNDVLDLAKIEAGKMPVHIEKVDLELLVREISLTIEPMVRRKKLEYAVDLRGPLPTLATDRTKIKQILLNLLSNAVKFTHDGRVELSVRPDTDGEGVELKVSDTGIGIRPEDLGKIFEDFRQVDQSSTREYGGTGLGLSITSKLLSLLGGTIRVDSCLGEGSTFTVWLPPRSREIAADEELVRAAMDAEETVVETGAHRTRG